MLQDTNHWNVILITWMVSDYREVVLCTVGKISFTKYNHITHFSYSKVI